jgi:hypothetical protein
MYILTNSKENILTQETEREREREKVTGNGIKLCNEERHNLHTSPVVETVIKAVTGSCPELA